MQVAAMRVWPLLLFVLFPRGFDWSATALYLPSFSPAIYCSESTPEDLCPNKIKIFVKTLSSSKINVLRDYSQFDLCTSDGNISIVENFGQALFGEKIELSGYNISFLKDEKCKVLCTKQYKPYNALNNLNLSILKRGIRLNFLHHFIVDDIPVTWCHDLEDGHQQCNTGFPIGCFKRVYNHYDTNECAAAIKVPLKTLQESTYYVLNHLEFTFMYHEYDKKNLGSVFSTKSGIITAIKVKPKSIKHEYPFTGCTSLNDELMGISSKKITTALNITYSYSVKFVMNNTIWPEYWDPVLDNAPPSSIQYFCIINSLMLTIYLTALISLIGMRIFQYDLAKYNGINNNNDINQVISWILIHVDVFKPPKRKLLLSVFLGSGVQVLSMTFIVLVLGLVGFGMPVNRGLYMTLSFILFVCNGALAGYVSSRMYKYFGGTHWKLNLIANSVFLPGVIFCILFMMNFVLWASDSAAVIPNPTIIHLCVLWFVLSIPLIFIGSLFGYYTKSIEQPVLSTQFPRVNSAHTMPTKSMTLYILGGIIPFGCFYIQLYFVLNSLWSNQVDTIFFPLLFVFSLLTIICSEINIVLNYFHLFCGDYKWWWRSYKTSAFTSFYLFCYLLCFIKCKICVNGFITGFIYFGYLLILLFLIFLMTGTIGFFATFWFVRKIYFNIIIWKSPSSNDINEPVESLQQ